jgi:hypothetical protein
MTTATFWALPSSSAFTLLLNLRSMVASGRMAGANFPPSPVPLSPTTRPMPVRTLERWPEMRVMSATLTARAGLAARRTRRRMQVFLTIMTAPPYGIGEGCELCVASEALLLTTRNSQLATQNSHATEFATPNFLFVRTG